MPNPAKSAADEFLKVRMGQIPAGSGRSMLHWKHAKG